SSSASASLPPFGYENVYSPTSDRSDSARIAQRRGRFKESQPRAALRRSQGYPGVGYGDPKVVTRANRFPLWRHRREKMERRRNEVSLMEKTPPSTSPPMLSRQA